MNNHATNSVIILLLYLLAFAAGALIPSQAAANAEISRQLGSTNYAALMLFVVGLVFVAIAAVFSRAALPALSNFAQAPLWSYAGGLIVGFYVLTVTFLAPRLGIGTTILTIVAGQIISAVLIDSFGLLQTVRIPLSGQKILGVVLMIIGVYLSKRR